MMGTQACHGFSRRTGKSLETPAFTSIVSTYRGRMVRDRIAMTGETTLRGRVTPVGGIKE